MREEQRRQPCAASPPIVRPHGYVGDLFGWRQSGDLHTGIDIGAEEGTPVLAILPGRVVRVYRNGEMNLFGHTVVLGHDAPAAPVTLYAHLQQAPALQRGQSVEAGQVIGAVGRTAARRGQSRGTFAHSGAHLHLEVLEQWPPAGPDLSRRDPVPVLDALGVVARERSRLRVREGSAAACAAEEIVQANASATRAGSSGGIGGMLPLALAFLWMRRK